MRSSHFFDLDVGQEDGNREFWFDAMTSTEARIAGDHKHPNGDVGPILFNPSNCKSTDTSESIIGNIYITTTNSGEEVTWKMLKNGCYEITIELNRGKLSKNYRFLEFNYENKRYIYIILWNFV